MKPIVLSLPNYCCRDQDTFDAGGVRTGIALCHGKNSKSHHLYARHGRVNISCARVKRSGCECVMGIKNLWQFLKKYGKQVQFRDFLVKQQLSMPPVGCIRLYMCQCLRMKIEKGQISLTIHDFSGLYVSIIGLVGS